MKRKYIVIGLGNFGLALSTKLTKLGHEVIGVDNNLSKVEQHKDEITNTICLDACDAHALNMLPLNEANAVIVAIGEDFGASVMATALLKQKKVKWLVSRPINSLHQTVLEAIGVNEILNPESISAELFSNRLHYEKVRTSFRIDENHVILEIPLAKKYWESTLQEADFLGRFGIQIIAVKRPAKGFNILGLTTTDFSVIEDFNSSTLLLEGDVLILFGKNSAFDKMIRMDEW